MRVRYGIRRHEAQLGEYLTNELTDTTTDGQVEQANEKADHACEAIARLVELLVDLDILKLEQVCEALSLYGVEKVDEPS